MKKVIIILAALLMTGMASGQEQETKRKKVAVVLSGGGAKGMAHIGALKVLEKANIPIDIITGTSMGSIIGGLYSIGYNAHSLDSMVRVQDWSYVITDKEDLRNQSLSDRKKQNTYLFSTGMTITLSMAVSVRSPTVRGTSVPTILRPTRRRCCTRVAIHVCASASASSVRRRKPLSLPPPTASRMLGH